MHSCCSCVCCHSEDLTLDFVSLTIHNCRASISVGKLLLQCYGEVVGMTDLTCEHCCHVEFCRVLCTGNQIVHSQGQEWDWAPPYDCFGRPTTEHASHLRQRLACGLPLCSSGSSKWQLEPHQPSHSPEVSATHSQWTPAPINCLMFV